MDTIRLNVVEFSFIVSLYVSDLPNVTISSMTRRYAAVEQSSLYSTYSNQPRQGVEPG